MSPDELALDALHAALAAENDPERRAHLVAQLAVLIDRRIWRARNVPDAERR